MDTYNEVTQHLTPAALSILKFQTNPIVNLDNLDLDDYDDYDTSHIRFKSIPLEDILKDDNINEYIQRYQEETIHKKQILKIVMTPFINQNNLLLSIVTDHLSYRDTDYRNNPRALEEILNLLSPVFYDNPDGPRNDDVTYIVGSILKNDFIDVFAHIDPLTTMNILDRDDIYLYGGRVPSERGNRLLTALEDTMNYNDVFYIRITNAINLLADRMEYWRKSDTRRFSAKWIANKDWARMNWHIPDDQLVAPSAQFFVAVVLQRIAKYILTLWRFVTRLSTKYIATVRRWGKESVKQFMKVQIYYPWDNPTRLNEFRLRGVTINDVYFLFRGIKLGNNSERGVNNRQLQIILNHLRLISHVLYYIYISDNNYHPDDTYSKSVFHHSLRALAEIDLGVLEANQRQHPNQNILDPNMDRDKFLDEHMRLIHIQLQFILTSIFNESRTKIVNVGGRNNEILNIFSRSSTENTGNQRNENCILLEFF
jgi:hypothetical protein